MSRRTTVAQPDLRRRLSDYQFFVTQIRRGVIFLIAFTGLMGAACVNGIPSINCSALADAYTLALGNLGALFLIEVCFIVIIVGVERKSENANIHTISTRRFRWINGRVFIKCLPIFCNHADNYTRCHKH
jgi:hypothetical protein